MEENKQPGDCTSKEEIRKEIDKIDREIIHLFAKRYEYVHEIVRFKEDEEGIIAQERKDQVIIQRGRWARNLGLDAETFENIYRILIDSNIRKELEILKSRKEE